MKAQGKAWTCGIAAVSNALECLGIRRTQGQVAALCHTSPDAGTDEEELKRALLACGCGVDEWEFALEALSKDWLRQHLYRRGPVVLCMDNFEHWVTCIGVCGDSYTVFDPALGMGLRVYSWAGLKTRWCLSRAKDGPIYYALGVNRP